MQQFWRRVVKITVQISSSMETVVWRATNHFCQFVIGTHFANNNRDLFYVIALFPHQHPAKVDPRRWHCKQSHNAAARVRRQQFLNSAIANFSREAERASANIEG
jgi:hypothetical protein